MPRPPRDLRDKKSDDFKSVYTDDHMNRRIRKTVYEWDSGDWDTANPVTDRKFMYANWLLLAELDATDTRDH